MTKVISGKYTLEYSFQGKAFKCEFPSENYSDATNLVISWWSVLVARLKNLYGFEPSYMSLRDPEGVIINWHPNP